MGPRVALLTPFGAPSVRGNAVTVDRVRRGLVARGLPSTLWDLSVTPASVVAAEVEGARPELVHAFHAYRTGPLALRLARRLEVPLVVTLTGTDVNHDLLDPDRAGAVRHVLEGAAAIVAFHDSVADRVAAVLPDLRSRLRIVAQACVFEAREAFDLGARWLVPPDRCLFLFAGGLRAVKRPRLALAALQGAVRHHPEIRLLYAGPIIDPEEGEALLADVAGRPWARHVGSVPHAQMASLLAQADVVLNCSVSEGGMANSVLEALTLGRAVLASDIEGNRSLIEHDVTGVLFGDERALAHQATRLASDPGLRTRLGAAGQARVRHLYSAAREIEGYLGCYRALVPVPTP